MTFQPIDSLAQAGDDQREVQNQPRLTVADALALPALCGPREMAALWGFNASQFSRLNRKGAFDKLKVTIPIGPRCFSGLLIGRYLSGEPLYIPSFGRKRS